MLRVLAMAAWIALLVTSATAAAQPTGRVSRVGYLTLGRSADGQEDLAAFRGRMQELGWTEGQNLLIETRWADGHRERLPALAADLVQQQLDVIVTITTPAALAAKAATTAIPIVMAGSADPVAMGLVQSLARPGGNVTGVANNPGPEFFTKQIQLLKEAAPHVSRVGVLMTPGPSPEELHLTAGQRAEAALGVVLARVDVAREAFDVSHLARIRPDALLVFPNSTNWIHRAAITDFARTRRLPTLYADGKQSLEATGGLLSYFTDWLELRRRAAAFVDRVLRGTRPVDLPVEEPRKFELVVNLRTARTLGLTIPQSILILADAVIQ